MNSEDVFISIDDQHSNRNITVRQWIDAYILCAQGFAKSVEDKLKEIDWLIKDGTCYPEFFKAVKETISKEI
jgi:hypothetical protein